jgi:hypothetical protein
MLWLPASACPCDRWKDNRAGGWLSGLDLKDRRQKVRSAVPSSRLRPGKGNKSSRCCFRSRLASAPILKTAAALNLFLQSIYFALGEREHEVTQLKGPMTLKRTDECADDTSSSYNLAILRILGGLIDLLKLSSQPFGFRGGLGWPTSEWTANRMDAAIVRLRFIMATFHTRSWG